MHYQTKIIVSSEKSVLYQIKMDCKMKTYCFFNHYNAFRVWKPEVVSQRTIFSCEKLPLQHTWKHIGWCPRKVPRAPGREWTGRIRRVQEEEEERLKELRAKFSTDSPRGLFNGEEWWILRSDEWAVQRKDKPIHWFGILFPEIKWFERCHRHPYDKYRAICVGLKFYLFYFLSYESLIVK